MNCNAPCWFMVGAHMVNGPPNTTWYWDGQKAWYTLSPHGLREPSWSAATFKPNAMRACGYKEIDNPFQPEYLRLQEGL